MFSEASVSHSVHRGSASGGGRVCPTSQYWYLVAATMWLVRILLECILGFVAYVAHKQQRHEAFCIAVVLNFVCVK